MLSDSHLLVTEHNPDLCLLIAARHLRREVYHDLVTKRREESSDLD